MRKLGLFVALAMLVLAGTGAWIAANTYANVEPATYAQLDPSELMRSSTPPPAERIVDYSLVFE